MSTTAVDAPTSSQALHYGLWAVQLLMAFAFGAAGMMKLGTPQDELIANGMAWAGRVPAGLILFIGLSEALGALGLILPAALRILPILTPIAAGALAFVMLLAAGEHGMAGEWSALPVNAVLGSFLLFIAWGRGVRAPIAPR